MPRAIGVCPLSMVNIINRTIFELEYQRAGNQLERDAITAQQQDYLFSIDAAESIYRLSNLEDQETARRNIPQFVSDLRASGNEDIASQLERRFIKHFKPKLHVNAE